MVSALPETDGAAIGPAGEEHVKMAAWKNSVSGSSGTRHRMYRPRRGPEPVKSSYTGSKFEIIVSELHSLNFLFVEHIYFVRSVDDKKKKDNLYI